MRWPVRLYLEFPTSCLSSPICTLLHLVITSQLLVYMYQLSRCWTLVYYTTLQKLENENQVMTKPTPLPHASANMVFFFWFLPGKKHFFLEITHIARLQWCTDAASDGQHQNILIW